MIKSDYDLIIDDGLHYPHSNLNFLSSAIKKYLKSGTWIVIEDIDISTEKFWMTIVKFLQNYLNTWLIKASKNPEVIMLVIKIR